MILKFENVQNIELFNNVDLASKVNLIIYDDYGRYVKYYGSIDGTKITLYTSYIPQVDVDEIIFLLNDANVNDVVLFMSPQTLIQNRDNEYVFKTVDNLDGLKEDKILKLGIRFKLNTTKPSVDCTSVKENLFVDGGAQDVINLQGYCDILEANNQTTGTIRGSDDNYYDVTIDELKQIITLIKDAALAQFQWKWAKEYEIYSCTTIDELSNVVI